MNTSTQHCSQSISARASGCSECERYGFTFENVKEIAMQLMESKR